MKLLKIAFIGLSVFLFGLKSQAQDVENIKLSLDQALELVNNKGVDVLIAQQTKAEAKAMLSQGNAVFLPQISIEEMGLKTNDPIGVFGIKLRQGIINASDFNPAVMNSPDAIHTFTTKVEVRQPIFNADGFYARASAKHQYSSANEQLKATKEHVKLKVKELYYQLAILDKQIVVQQDYLETNKAYQTQASNYYEQGLISKSEFLGVQVEVLNAEQALLDAQNNRETTNDALSLLLGLEGEKLIHVIDRLEPTSATDISVNPNNKGNAAVVAIEHQLKASSAMLKSAKVSFLPSLNAFGSYELHDTKVFGNKSDNYTIGATLRWDLFKGYKQAGAVAQRKAELRKTELVYQNSLNKYQADVRNTRRSIKLALHSIELSKLKTEQADEDARMRADRYAQGIEKTTDLLAAETSKLASQLGHLQAQYQYFVSIAQLEYLLETEL